MQELISALTAHEEECSREFEADLSAFCTRHMDAQLVQQLRQLVAEGEEDLAYRAFYALTIIYRNRKAVSYTHLAEPIPLTAHNERSS